jgi:hypothetical protein
MSGWGAPPGAGCGAIAHALAAGTNSIPTTAALKVVVTARRVIFMTLPLSFGEILLPETPLDESSLLRIINRSPFFVMGNNSLAYSRDTSVKTFTGSGKDITPAPPR